MARPVCHQVRFKSLDRGDNGFKVPFARSLASRAAAECVADIKDKILVTARGGVKPKLPCVFRGFHWILLIISIEVAKIVDIHAENMPTKKVEDITGKNCF